MHAHASNSFSHISAKKRRANRRNARKSTGPRTDEGKAKSKMNATTHGFFCADLVLPGEVAENMQYIREEMLEAHRPQNMNELLLVDRIVCATWKLNRLQRSELHMHANVEEQIRRGARAKLRKLRENMQGSTPDRAMQRLGELAEADLDISVTLATSISAADDSFDKLNRFEQRLENMIHRCQNQLRLIRKAAGINDPAQLPASPYSKKQLETLDDRYEMWCRRIQSQSGYRPPPLEKPQPQPQPEQSQSSAEQPTAQAVASFQAVEEMQRNATKQSNIQNEPTASAGGAKYAWSEDCGKYVAVDPHLKPKVCPPKEPDQTP